MDIQVTVSAPEITAALLALAGALKGTSPATFGHLPTHPVVNPAPPAALAAPAPAAAAVPAPPAALPVTNYAPVTPVPMQAPAPLPPVNVPPPVVPTAAAPAYTHERIMTAGAALMDAGKAEQLTALLQTFGVAAVTMLKPEQLGAFAVEMRKLGAQI